MKYYAAYLLVKSNGKENPNITDIRDIIEQIGIEYDHNKAEYVIKNFQGKNINDLFNQENIKRMIFELKEEIKQHQNQDPMKGDNSNYQDKYFGLTMTLRLTENSPLEKYALTLIDNNNYLNCAGKKIDLRKEDIAHNICQRWHFGQCELSTVINPELYNNLVWDIADQYSLNPHGKTPFYVFQFHGRHNQHFIFKNNMIFARQNGHVVTYVGGDNPFVMMEPKEELKERQTFHIEMEIKEKEDIKYGIHAVYQNGNEFQGILNHFISESGGNYDNYFEIIPSSVENDTNIPINAINFEDKTKYFATQNIANSWICFQFKKNHIIPKN